MRLVTYKVVTKFFILRVSLCSLLQYQSRPFSDNFRALQEKCFLKLRSVSALNNELRFINPLDRELNSKENLVNVFTKIGARTWSYAANPDFAGLDFRLFKERTNWSYDDTFPSSLALANDYQFIVQDLSIGELCRRLIFFTTYYIPDGYYMSSKVQLFINMLYSYETGYNFRYTYDIKLLKCIYFFKIWHEVTNQVRWRDIRNKKPLRVSMHNFWALINLWQYFYNDKLFDEVLPESEISSKIFTFFLLYFQKIYWSDYADIFYEFESDFRALYESELGSSSHRSVVDVVYICFINMQFQSFYENLIISSVDYTKCLPKEEALFAYNVEWSENRTPHWDFKYLQGFVRPVAHDFPKILRRVKQHDKSLKQSFSRTRLSWTQLWDLRVAQLDRELEYIQSKKSS